MIDWNRIDTLFLDMDGTLLDLSFDNYFWRELVPRHYAQAHGLGEEEARLGIAASYGRMEGCLEWYCLDYWSTELQLDLIALKQTVADAIAIMPHAEAFLGALQRLPLRVVLLTNAHPASLGLKMQRTGLARFFSGIVCSHELGVPKEAADFWVRLNEVEPYRPRRSALIDDSLAVLDAARVHGIEYTIAVRRPDLSLPARMIDQFPAIDGLEAIMPP